MLRWKEAAMNIRKQVDYSTLYQTLDRLMELNLTDTELCYKIGQAICNRSEKGAAVVAVEYLRERYPNRTGRSPRNLRRMRDFYRAYENEPESVQLTLQIGWTLNVIILEECSSAEERAWHLGNTLRNSWKKAVLLDMIKGQAWLENHLGEQTDSCYTEEYNDAVSENGNNEKDPLYLSWEYLPQPNGRVRDEGLGEESRTGVTVSDCVGGYQSGGDRKPGLSAGTPQAGRAWDLLQQSRRTAAHQQRLRGIRFYYSAETTVGFGGIFVLSTGLYCNLPAFISLQKSSKQPTLLTVKILYFIACFTEGSSEYMGNGFFGSVIISPNKRYCKERVSATLK